MARKKGIYGYVLCIERPECAERAVLFCQTLAEAEEELRKYVPSAFVTAVRDEDILDALAEDNERAFIFECSNRVEQTPFARSFEAA